MIVIYAEKPDMAGKIASVLGGVTFDKKDKKQGYYKIMFKGRECAVTWGYGHLCTLADASQYNPEYRNWSKMPIPFIPEIFQVVLNERSKMPIKSTYKVVQQLFSGADYIINATDFDREGELIFYYLYSYMGCRKNVMRAKLASTTPQGIKNAFENLMPCSDFASLLASAQCRSAADWVVGCNLTAAMTVKYGRKGEIYSIGRVQTPTLAMVVGRDEAICSFKPEDYFVVEGRFKTKDGKEYKGVYKQKRFDKRDDAQYVLSKCQGGNGIVTETSGTRTQKTFHGLYNLDLLQMETGKLYGFSGKRTLDATQKLYEKGYVTYPRTDCTYLPEDMEQGIGRVQEMLRTNGYGGLFNADASSDNMHMARKCYFDDSKLGSHYAIIPTEMAPKNLDSDEEKVYGLIADSVIRMLYPPAVLENTRVITEVGGEKFITTGTSVVSPGWLFVHGRVKEETVPHLSEGECVNAECVVQAKKTQPPKHFTDSSLLKAMVSAGRTVEDEELRDFMEKNGIEGIGTVATRAAIVENLIQRGFIVRDKKNILATERGIALVHAVPVDEVKSASMTAGYEKQLNLIMKGEQEPSAFLNGIYRDVRKWCGLIMGQKGEGAEKLSNAPNTKLICPVCASPLHRYKWGYGCTEYRNGCKFSVGAICGKMLSEGQLGTLLSKEKIGPLKGFKKKDGTEFSATLVLEKVMKNGKIIDYKISFEKKSKVDTDNLPDLYGTCPKCGSRMKKGRCAWECAGGCDVKIPYVISERVIEPEIAEILLSYGETYVVDGFVSKKGNPYMAGLKLVDGKVKFVFPEKY